MAGLTKPMIDLFKRALPVISVTFDIDEEVWAVNCLSCWGDGDVPQFLGQFETEPEAIRFGDLHTHWGDTGIGIPVSPIGFLGCEECTCTFTAWPAYIEPLGAGRVHSRRMLDIETADHVWIRTETVEPRPCGVCNWLLNSIGRPVEPRSLWVFWRRAGRSD